MSSMEKSWGRILILEKYQVCWLAEFFNLFSCIVPISIAPQWGVSIKVTSNHSFLKTGALIQKVQCGAWRTIYIKNCNLVVAIPHSDLVCIGRVPVKNLHFTFDIIPYVGYNTSTSLAAAGIWSVPSDIYITRWVKSLLKNSYMHFSVIHNFFQLYFFLVKSTNIGLKDIKIQKVFVSVSCLRGCFLLGFKFSKFSWFLFLPIRFRPVRLVAHYDLGETFLPAFEATSQLVSIFSFSCTWHNVLGALQIFFQPGARSLIWLSAML